MLTGGQLLAEFATNVMSSLLAAVLVSLAIDSLGSFLKRAFFVSILGLSAGIAVNVPYWNWYGFPAVFTLAEMLEHLIGFAIVGIVIAIILKPRQLSPVNVTDPLSVVGAAQ